MAASWIPGTVMEPPWGETGRWVLGADGGRGLSCPPAVSSPCSLGLGVLVSGGEDSAVLSQAGILIANMGKLRPPVKGSVCLPEATERGMAKSGLTAGLLPPTLDFACGPLRAVGLGMAMGIQGVCLLGLSSAVPCK